MRLIVSIEYDFGIKKISILTIGIDSTGWFTVENTLSMVDSGSVNRFIICGCISEEAVVKPFVNDGLVSKIFFVLEQCSCSDALMSLPVFSKSVDDVSGSYFKLLSLSCAVVKLFRTLVVVEEVLSKVSFLLSIFVNIDWFIVRISLLPLPKGFFSDVFLSTLGHSSSSTFIFFSYLASILFVSVNMTNMMLVAGVD